MRPLVIFTHQGFGDHLICNGLVRHHAETRTVVVVAWHEYFESVRFMYQDLPSITVLPVPHDTHNEPGKALVDQLDRSGCEVMRLGYLGNDPTFRHENFASEFYRQAQVPFEVMHAGFKTTAPLPRSRLPIGSFVLMHDYGTMLIDIHKLPEMARVHADRRLSKDRSLPENLFDNLPFIETACQIHCIWSWLVIMVELIAHQESWQHRLKDKLFLHRYARPDANYGFPLKLNWQFID